MKYVRFIVQVLGSNETIRTDLDLEDREDQAHAQSLMELLKSTNHPFELHQLDATVYAAGMLASLAVDKAARR